MMNGEEDIPGFFFTTLTELMNDLHKCKYSINPFKRWMYKKYEKRILEKLQLLYAWRRIDEIQMSDFFNFLESNRDIFPEEKFLIKHLDTEDILYIDSNINLYDLRCTEIRINHRTKQFFISCEDHKGYKSLKRVKFKDLSQDLNSEIVHFLEFLMYICCATFVKIDYEYIDRVFNDVNSNSIVYYRSENN